MPCRPMAKSAERVAEICGDKDRGDERTEDARTLRLVPRDDERGRLDAATASPPRPPRLLVAEVLPVTASFPIDSVPRAGGGTGAGVGAGAGAG